MRADVARHEAPAGARAEAVSAAGEELLAGSGLARHEDRQGGARRLLEIPEDGQESGIACDDADSLTLSTQPFLLGVAEWLGDAPRPPLVPAPLEPGPRLLFLRSGRRRLRAH